MKLNRVFLCLAALLVAVFLRKLVFSLNGIAGNFGDIYLHYYPLKHLITEHIVNGRMPLWNPYIFAGQPLLANPQSAVFYPFSVLFYIFPLIQAFNFFYTAHAFASFVFTYLLAQHLRFSRTASLLGAVIFSFSSFMIYNIPAGHPVMMSGFAWLPLIILMLGPGRQLNTRINTLILSLMLLFQFLSGHFQPVFISAIFMVVYAVKNRFLTVKQLSLAALFALLMASLQFLPTLQLSQAIEKGFWPGLVKAYSLPFPNLANLILPNFFGNVMDGDFVRQANFSFFFEKHNLYFGLLPLLLSAAGVYLSIKRRSYLYIFLVVLGLSLATGLHTRFDFIYSGIPGLDLLRVPARFYLIALAGFTLLACAGWEIIQKRSGVLLKAALLLVVLIDLFIWNDKFIFTQDMGSFAKKSELSNIINPLFRIATDSEKLSSNRSMLYHYYNINGYEAIFMKKYTDYLGFQEAKALGSTGMARIGLSSPLSKGLSVGYYISGKKIGFAKLAASLPNDIGIYEPLNPQPRVSLAQKLEVISNYDKNFEYSPEQLEFLTKTKYPPSELLMVGGKPDFLPPALPKGKMLSCSFKSDMITSEALLPSGGAVLFSEIYYPGWSVWAAKNRYTVFKGNGCLRTVFLPPGDYTGVNSIFMYFHPSIWLIGLYVTLCSITCILFFVFSKEASARIPGMAVLLEAFKPRKEE